MNNYHATPYDQSALGFYFDNYEDYQNKAKNHKNEYGDLVEEFEIQFIDGDNHQLFKALGINQANLETWFNDYELLDGDDLIRAIYMGEYLTTDMSEILDRLDEVGLFEGRAKDYAEEYIEDSGLLSELPENLRYYFDVEAFARDMLLSGDISEVEIHTLKPEKAALPITETGYRSHFTPKGNIDEYDSAVDFVRAWLDHEAQSETWKMAQEEARQMSLF